LGKLFNLKIGPKIFLGFGFFAVLILAVTLVSIYYLQGVGNRLVVVAEEDMVLQKAALELRLAVAEESDGVRGYLLSGDESLLDSFLTARGQFADTATELGNLVQSEEDSDLLADIRRHHAAFMGVADEQISVYEQGFPQTAVFLWKNLGSNIKATLDARLSEFIARQEQVIVADTQRTRNEQNQAVVVSVVLVALGLTIGIAGGVWSTRSITRPLAHLADTATRIEAGDLSLSARIEYMDEVGVTAQAFNNMTSRLRKLVDELETRVAARTHELEHLERLGRAIINTPPDASELPKVLEEHVPLMFPDSHVDICVSPDQILLHHPKHRIPVAPKAREWLCSAVQSGHYPPGTELPWGGQQTSREVISSPVIDFGTGDPVGGVLLSRQRGADATTNLLPAIQSLAAQVASALHGAEVYAQTLAYDRVEQELAMAGRIQASFLPSSVPTLPEWDLTATLLPTKETSGDFYDYIQLSNGRLGLLIADVTDKGMGAALYMALSRTLIRTYAVEKDATPESVFRAANRRILEDAHAGLFVTAFYGILDPINGTLTYSNAGHNPPYVLRVNGSDAIQELRRTGIPLGIYAGGDWEQRTVNLAPGDLLFLYTDGITEAQDVDGVFFDEERLQKVVKVNHGRSAEEIQNGVLSELNTFVGDAPQSDDITAMVIVRSTEEKAR
jgi:serine phosphatase RsbU (regulator of sigma subunit)/CHASE3 domain sensor protein